MFRCCGRRVYRLIHTLLQEQIFPHSLFRSFWVKSFAQNRTLCRSWFPSDDFFTLKIHLYPTVVLLVAEAPNVILDMSIKFLSESFFPLFGVRSCDSFLVSQRFSQFDEICLVFLVSLLALCLWNYDEVLLALNHCHPHIVSSLSLRLLTSQYFLPGV